MTPPDPLDDFDDAAEPAGHGPSLAEDVSALFGDGKTYLQAEYAFQKSRAGYTANRLKDAALYGAIALGLLHLALIGLTVGIVIALTPLIGPWLATGAVVVVLAAIAGWFLLKLRSRVEDMRTVYDRGEA